MLNVHEVEQLVWRGVITLAEARWYMNDGANKYYLEGPGYVDEQGRWVPEYHLEEKEPINMPRPQRDALKDELNVMEEKEIVSRDLLYWPDEDPLILPPQGGDASIPFPSGESGTVDPEYRLYPTHKWITRVRK